jgi:hypothetical protein
MLDGAASNALTFRKIAWLNKAMDIFGRYEDAQRSASRMDNHKSAAQRIRPVLEAMQRSIDSARRKRVHGVDAPTPAVLASPVARPESSIGARPAVISPATLNPLPQHQVIANGDAVNATEAGQRLKARPKRFSPSAPFEQPAYRAQAS